MIVRVIQRYHPQWEAPHPPRLGWQRVWCPFHDDRMPSAAVNYELDSFSCLACGVKGNPVTLIQRVEGISYSEAKRIAKAISEGGSGEVPPVSAGKSGRGVPEDQGSSVSESRKRGRRKVQARVRRRPLGGP